MFYKNTILKIIRLKKYQIRLKVCGKGFIIFKNKKERMNFNSEV